eukprot:31216-Pelagococcus_subviridis.AAC.2
MNELARMLAVFTRWSSSNCCTSSTPPTTCVPRLLERVLFVRDRADFGNLVRVRVGVQTETEEPPQRERRRRRVIGVLFPDERENLLPVPDRRRRLKRTRGVRYPKHDSIVPVRLAHPQRRRVHALQRVGDVLESDLLDRPVEPPGDGSLQLRQRPPRLRLGDARGVRHRQVREVVLAQRERFLVRAARTRALLERVDLASLRLELSHRRRRVARRVRDDAAVVGRSIHKYVVRRSVEKGRDQTLNTRARGG